MYDTSLVTIDFKLMREIHVTCINQHCAAPPAISPLSPPPRRRGVLRQSSLPPPGSRAARPRARAAPRWRPTVAAPRRRPGAPSAFSSGQVGGGKGPTARHLRVLHEKNDQTLLKSTMDIEL